MKLRVLGSGSSGNCYLLTNGEETLVIEAGIPFREVKKALGWDIRSIRGVIISHRHSDHCKFVHEYEEAGIPVWKPYESEQLQQDILLGRFYIQSFELVHDVPCCGFLIRHVDLRKMLYVTDTEYVKYTFRDLDVVLIEANYSEKYIDKTEAKYKHVLTGHMSIETTLDCIAANRSSKMRNVILCHLSGTGSNMDEFLQQTREIVPSGCKVDVAIPGVSIDISEVPF